MASTTARGFRLPSRILPPDRLRRIAFGHFEADECGAMNERLAAAAHAAHIDQSIALLERAAS
jgi:hypothetical protein